MNERHHTPWTRLATAARRAPASAGSLATENDLVVPVGFATRVVARAGLRPTSAGLFGAGFERLASRALGLACACAVAFSVWGSLPATAEARSTDAATTDAYLDPVGAYLEAVQSS